jgi:hypothetical protein
LPPPLDNDSAYYESCTNALYSILAILLPARAAPSHSTPSNARSVRHPCQQSQQPEKTIPLFPDCRLAQLLSLLTSLTHSRSVIVAVLKFPSLLPTLQANHISATFNDIHIVAHVDDSFVVHTTNPYTPQRYYRYLAYLRYHQGPAKCRKLDLCLSKYGYSSPSAIRTRKSAWHCRWACPSTAHETTQHVSQLCDFSSD